MDTCPHCGSKRIWVHDHRIQKIKNTHIHGKKCLIHLKKTRYDCKSCGCRFERELGDISNFSKPKELVAFFGLDPGVSQSGTYNRKNNKISKRGSPHVRSILHMLAKSNVYPNRNREYLNPVMRAYFEKNIYIIFIID